MKLTRRLFLSLPAAIIFLRPCRHKEWKFDLHICKGCGITKERLANSSFASSSTAPA